MDGFHKGLQALYLGSILAVAPARPVRFFAPAMLQAVLDSRLERIDVGEEILVAYEVIRWRSVRRKAVAHGPCGTAELGEAAESIGGVMRDQGVR